MRGLPSDLRRHGHTAGFAYLGLLFLIAMLSISSVATLTLGAVAARRPAEEELLVVGTAFQEALTSYANFTPPGTSPRPATLQDLLQDPRTPVLRRHLRQIYADPMTGKAEWGLVRAPDGKGITGVHSLAEGKPIKQGKFEQRFKHFEGAQSYREWDFSGL